MNAFRRILKTKIKLLLGRGVYKSYSQFGEDIVVQSLLRNVKDGIYVDVGAFDPVLYSNTYHFYKKGWHGLVIDPNPELTKRYAFLRPRDIFINCGISDKNGELTYYSFNMPA